MDEHERLMLDTIKLVELIRNDELPADEVAKALVELIRHEIAAAERELVNQLFWSGSPR